MVEMTADEVRKRVGADISDAEVAELIAAYKVLARGIDTFPLSALHGLEPPVRSVAGPRPA